MTAADADVVWIVHTDKMVYGYALNTGTADFNMNGGIRYQPGCPWTLPLTLTKAGTFIIFFHLNFFNF